MTSDTQLCITKSHLPLYAYIEVRGLTECSQDSRAAAYDFWRTLFRAGNAISAGQQEAENAMLQSPNCLLTGIQLDGSAFRSILDHESGCDLELWRLALEPEV